MDRQGFNEVSRLRVSDADRDTAASVISNALAEGRLTAEEHSDRLDAIYSAKTHAEIVPLLDDLPGHGPAVAPASTGQRRYRRVSRWKTALANFWRREPAIALGLYFLLAVAVASCLRLGGHLEDGNRLNSRSTWALDGSAAGLLWHAFFTWRMWLGGAMSWTISLLCSLVTVAAAASTFYQAPSLYLFGLTALSLAGVVPLFASAVLDRVVDDLSRSPRAARSPLASK
jgi:hypothetical protein